MRYGSPSIMAAMVGLQRALCHRIVVCRCSRSTHRPRPGPRSSACSSSRGIRGTCRRWTSSTSSTTTPDFSTRSTRSPRPRSRTRAPITCCSRFTACPSAEIHKSDPSGETCLASTTAATGSRTRAAIARNASRPRARSPAGSASQRARGPCASSRGSATSRGSSRTPTCCSTSSRSPAASGSPCCAPRSSPIASRPSRKSASVRARSSRRRAADELVLVPSLNSSPAWVDAVVDIAKRHG